jgi:hypothetical protein
MAERHVIIICPDDDPLGDGWDPPDALARALDGRRVRGFWESQVQRLLQRKGWTLAGLRTRLANAGCVYIVRDSVDDDPSDLVDLDRGTRWKARNGWVDRPAP